MTRALVIAALLFVAAATANLLGQGLTDEERIALCFDRGGFPGLDIDGTFINCITNRD